MRAVIHSAKRTWELAWGIQLIGAAPECEIRLPDAPGTPPVGAVVVRWLENVLLLGVGTPPALSIDDEPVFERDLELRRLPMSELMGTWGATGVSLQVGPHELVLSVEDLPSPSRAEEFSAADLEGVMRSAMAHALKSGKDPAGYGSLDTLPELVARMTGSISARVVPTTPQGATAPAATSAHPGPTLTVRSMTATMPATSLFLERHPEPAQTFQMEKIATSISITLEDALHTLAAGRGSAADPPAYGGGAVKLPQMRHGIGAYTLLGPDDFDHLDLPAGRVRAPQTLISSIGGRLELVDLATETQLEVDGRAVRRATVRTGSQVKICGVPATVEIGEELAPDMAMPGRIFRHLGLWTDPITQMARLGLLLPHLRDRQEQRLAYLVAAVSAVRGAGVVASAMAPGGPRRYTNVTMRWLGHTLSQSHFENCHMSELALRRAAEGGGQFVSAEALKDPRLTETDWVPPDRVAPFWGPLAVFTRPTGETLMVWKHPWNRSFHPAELKFLEAILNGMRVDGLLPPQDLQKASLPGTVPAAPPGPCLKLARVRFPLSDITVLGRGSSADARILWEPSLSDRHLLVVRDGSGHRFFDMRSFHGVKFDGKRSSEAMLQPGKDLVLGSSTLNFEGSENDKAAADAGEEQVLPEDVELEPDAPAVQAVTRLIQLGRDLPAAADPDERIRLAVAAASTLLDCGFHVVQLAGSREALRPLATSTGVPLAEPMLAAARPLVVSAVVTGRPQSAGGAPLIAAAAPVLSAGQDRQLAVLFHRDAPFTSDQVRQVWSFAGLLGAAAGAVVPVLELGNVTVPVPGPIWIGRAKECQLVLDHPRVSRRHALVVPGKGDPPFLWVTDFVSESGVTWRGKKVERVKVRDGDEFMVGPMTVKARIPRGPAEQATSARGRLLDRAPALSELGRRLAAGDDVLAALVAQVQTCLDAGRVAVVGGGGELLAGVSRLDIELEGTVASFAHHSEVRILLQWVRSARQATVRTLDPDRIYRQAGAQSVQLVFPLAEKTALGIPFSTEEGDPRVLVIGTMRRTGVAFRPSDLALAAAAVAAVSGIVPPEPVEVPQTGMFQIPKL